MKPNEVVRRSQLHTYIKSKKTTNRFGLLLIEMQENTLISFWETEALKQE
jgi:hypothetical protein